MWYWYFLSLYGFVCESVLSLYLDSYLQFIYLSKSRTIFSWDGPFSTASCRPVCPVLHWGSVNLTWALLMHGMHACTHIQTNTLTPAALCKVLASWPAHSHMLHSLAVCWLRRCEHWQRPLITWAALHWCYSQQLPEMYNWCTEHEILCHYCYP